MIHQPSKFRLCTTWHFLHLLLNRIPQSRTHTLSSSFCPGPRWFSSCQHFCEALVGLFSCMKGRFPTYNVQFFFTFPVLHCHPGRAGLGTGSGWHRVAGHCPQEATWLQCREVAKGATRRMRLLLRNLYSRLSGSPVYYRVGRLGTPWHVGSWMRCEFCQQCVFLWDLGGRREARGPSLLPPGWTHGFCEMWVFAETSEALSNHLPRCCGAAGPLAFSCSFLISALSSTSGFSESRQ